MLSEGMNMEAAGWQQALGQALDIVNTVGLLFLVRLAPLITGILLALLSAWVIRRKVRGYRCRIAAGATSALKETGKLGVQAAGVAAHAAVAAANEAKLALQEHALPAAAAAVRAAKPQVHGAAIVAADAAKAGAGQAGDMLAKGVPVAKAAAGVAKDAATALGILAKVKSAELLDKAKAAQKRREEG